MQEEMIVSIASGKGGTGKTTVAVNMALALGNVHLIDCDVEEPNCHIFLKPEKTKTEEISVKVPEIDENLCNLCGKCSQFCRYNALAVAGETVLQFAELCHSCGGCALVCPKDAIKEGNRVVGVVEYGKKDGIIFSQGRMNIGEAMASPVIRELKKRINNGSDVIIDAPPGSSCAVIESVKGSDYCILVTEPTPFGLHDLKIAVEMLESMSIPHGVVVNRDGIGDKKVYEYCKKKSITILAKIPHDKKIAALYSEGKPLLEEIQGYKATLIDMFKKIRGDIS